VQLGLTLASANSSLRYKLHEELSCTQARGSRAFRSTLALPLINQKEVVI
jgi:hypothetical protein